MSIVQATLELDKKKWTVENAAAPGKQSIALQVNVADAETASINHFSFGYTLTLNDSVVAQCKFPEVGTIISIAPTNLISETILVTPNTTYSLYLWAENGGDRTEKTFELRTPIPPQPHLSWTWNGNAWVSPVPLPTNGPKGAAYKWSEAQQKWILLVPPLSQYDNI
jgi:hypothetical protein